MKVTVLVGGVGGARFLRACWPPPRRATRSARWSTSATTSGCTGCGSAPTWTPACTPSAAGIDTERGWGRAERDLVGQGGAGRLRRRPDVVRARRPGHRHPPRAHPDAAGGLPAVAGHRGAVRPLAAGRRLMPSQRRPGRDPRRGRRPGVRRASAGHPLPGVVGQHRAPLPAPSFASVGRERPRLPGRARRDRRRRRRAGRAVEPGGEHRHDPRRARDAGRALRNDRAGRRGVADHRRASRARDGRRVPGGDRRASPPPRPSAGTTARAPPAACSTAGSCTPATGPRCRASRCARCRC